MATKKRMVEKVASTKKQSAKKNGENAPYDPHAPRGDWWTPEWQVLTGKAGGLYELAAIIGTSHTTVIRWGKQGKDLKPGPVSQIRDAARLLKVPSPV